MDERGNVVKELYKPIRPRHTSISGQIATLIVLIVAIIFLFMAVVINVGRVVHRKTRIDNAADGAAIQLASYLGSYAHKLSVEYLDGGLHTDWERCFGFFWRILAAIVLIVAGIILICIGGEVLIAIGIGLIAGGAVTGAFAAYDQYVVQPKIIAKINRQFQKMPLKDQFGERAIFYALMNTVVDPGTEVDLYDFDEDGEYGYDDEGNPRDKVGRFARWYYERLRDLTERLGLIRLQLKDFLSEGGPVNIFGEGCDTFSGYLYTGDPSLIDATLVGLLADLEDEGFDLSFFYEVPPFYNDEELDEEEEEEEEWPGTYTEYLRVDFLIEQTNDFFLPWVEQVTDEENFGAIYATFEEIFRPQVEDHCEEWDDWDDDLDRWVDRLEEIKDEIDSRLGEISFRLSELAEGAEEAYVGEEDDLQDEQSRLEGLRDRIVEAIGKIEPHEDEIATFLVTALTFLAQTQGDDATYREATYSWQDSLGWHHVRVKISSYKMPYIKLRCKKRWYGKKCRLELRDYKGDVTCRIARFDEGSSTQFAGGVPLWRFRYVKAVEAENLAPDEHFQNPDEVLDEYGYSTRGTAYYTYNQLPRMSGPY